MEYIEKIKKMLCKELDEYAMKQKLTGGDLDMIWKLTDTVKNLDKIEMLEEESGGYSEARGGRGRGRSYMGGSSYDDDMMYSERRGRGRNARRDKRYSRDDAKDHMMNKLGEMMTSADEEQREILKDAMRKIERA